uniref:Tyrosine-protein kinase receptor n=1 Tax=Timema shepardi TaxID=629360 RepID=A0A7R9ASH2_TIMSH|nr:unnamed protein product [Timema shepardi]
MTVCTNCGDRTCRANGHDCCHESCLGGCSRANSSEDCTVCKGVLFQKKCIKSCPVNTYRYLNRRCILEQECLDMPVPREQVNDYRDKPWKAFNNTCILDCPHGYMEMKSSDGRRYQCEPCKGPCRKECAGVNVDSIASAQKLRGCTYIKGSLEIQIRGGKNIVKELEENLNMIEEIEGYLKIVRSFPLVSLNFLKNLKVIHGKELESHKYVFVVLDNQNLQELWDWSTRPANLQINKGRLFFHFNPKLCLYKIERLKHVANFSDFSDLDVARNSNGDKVASPRLATRSGNVTALKVYVTQTSSQAVVLMWSQFDHYDPRSLLGYVVYSTEAPYQNVTLYDGRDACGADGWKVDDVHVPDNQSASVYHLLSRLKPYTQYAYYVKTYTIATERTGAQSPIYYFRTSPDIPSVPMSLQVFSNSSSSMVVTWQPPTEPNGNITHYIVSGSWERDDPKFLSQRNYCFDRIYRAIMTRTKHKFSTINRETLNFASKVIMADHFAKAKSSCTQSATPALTLPEKKPTFLFPEKTPEKKSEEETCSCEEKTEPNIKLETEVLSQIDFEDTLHNHIYIKRLPQNRSKREVLGGDLQLRSKEHKEEKVLGDEMSVELTKENGGPNKIVNAVSTKEVMGILYIASSSEAGIYESFEIQVNGTNMYVVTNLSHFAEYTIAVQACRERMPSENSSVITCSAKSIFTARTQALHGADNIDPKNLVLEVSNQTQATEVKLKWMEPPTPNGIIVTYHIMYTPVDNGDMKPQIECIPASEFQKSHKEYLLKRVAPGNYSIQVRATSLAGHGQYTPKRYIYIQDPSTPSGQDVWIGVLVGGGFVVLIIFGAIFVMRRNYKGVPNMKLIASVNPEYVNTVYVPDEWEVSRKKVEMLRELGQGSFGMVYEGIGHDIVEGQPTIRCAIKTVNEHATDRERSEFLNEASVMKAFNTHHVVRLLGVVSQGQPVLVIMELMAFGDLKSYLRSHRPDVSDDPTIQPPTLKRILQMAIEIADGMAYLSAKKFVHRDLAARNCMVAEDLTVKIGDFGMTRDIYETDYYRKGTKGLLPVRWMAPESLKDGVFTSFSDVWSYGVVLWEMATLASQPYQGLSNDQVLRYVIEGGVMERPENCPDKLYELMRQCWQHKTTLRPPFMELVSQLLTDISSNFAQVSFYHSTAGQEVRTQYAITMAPTSDDPSTPLRMTHDIEDFSLGGSDEDEGELDQEEEDNTPVPPTQLNPHYHSMSATQSQPSKMGNGSAVTTPTAPNGWISNNGSGTAAPANPTILMKTTEC